MTAIEFPPMQKGASFNLDAVKAKIEAAQGGDGQVAAWLRLIAWRARRVSVRTAPATGKEADHETDRSFS